MDIARDSKSQEPAEEEQIERVPSDDDNYHGLTLACVLVYLAILVLAFAQMMVIVASGLTGQNMAADIGGTSLVMWLPQLIMIENVAMAIPVSQAADYWGRKPFLIFFCALAIAGSIIVSCARSMAVALVGNFLASLITTAQPLTWTMASEIVPKGYRVHAQAIISMMYALGSMAALLAGSQLNKSYDGGWRIFWYINAGLFAVSGALIFFLYRPPVLPLQVALTFKEKIRRLDWVGICLLAPSLTLFVMALTWSDNPYSWGDAHILAPFILGIAGIIVLGIYEYRFKKDGLFHHGLFRHRNVPIALFAVGLEGIAFIGANSYLPMEVSLLGFETDPLMVGLRFAIVFMVAAPMSVVTGYFCTRLRRLRLPLIVSFLCFCAFYATMISVDLDDSKNVWGYAIFLGLGLGIVVPIVVASLHLSIPHELLSLSSGLSLTARVAIAAIGLPVYGAIFNSQVRKHVPTNVASAVLPLGLPQAELGDFIQALNSHSPYAFDSIPGVTPHMVEAGVHASQLAYVKAFRAIHIAGLCISFVGVVASCFLEDPKDQFTMHVDAPLDGEGVESDEKRADSSL